MITDSAVSAAPAPKSAPGAAEHLLAKAAAAPSSFAELNLPEPLLRAVTDEGYEQPTPIQAQAIPLLLQGRDVIGQAQTGTGKTAAFSLPLLRRVDPAVAAVQALVLTPTRELALQVATAVHTYAQHLPRVSVLPIYGGDSMVRQTTRLQRGAHVVVGTPGRILDHLRRGSLVLSQVGFLVLDEADEMLRMGFLEDVEEILAQTPAERQTALLSATLPPEIRRVARRHLREPEHVSVAAATLTVASTEQRVAIVPESLKLEAVVRLLETEAPEAALIFTRTRLGAGELADKLSCRGYPAEALHSDLSQQQRLTVLQRLRDRRAQVVVATDVAARGLDIDHISHVINFDLPGDAETYVHRIGRTGRAGRAGVALLLATPSQRPMLRVLERFTQRPLEPITLPTYRDVARRRRQRAEAALLAVTDEELADYQQLCSELARTSGREPVALAAAALRLLTAERPLFGGEDAHDPLARLAQSAHAREERARTAPVSARPSARPTAPGAPRPARPQPPTRPQPPAHKTSDEQQPDSSPPGEEAGWGGPMPRRASTHPRRQEASPVSAEQARILVAVGHRHAVRPSDIVGAIANEAGISGREIGHIEILDGASIVEIPATRLQRVISALRSATIRGQNARPRMLGDEDAIPEQLPPSRPPRPPRAAPTTSWSWDETPAPRARAYAPKGPPTKTGYGERPPKRRSH